MATEFERRSGVFLHPTSLPGEHGIGTLGAAAYEFVDQLAAAEQSLWQLCPLGPAVPEYGNSPYQTYSAFAGNPLLIDLRRLVDRDLLEADELPSRDFPDDHVDYEPVQEAKIAALRRAADRFESDEDLVATREWLESETEWLADYALFRALQSHFDGDPYWTWPEPVRERDPDAIATYRDQLSAEVRFRSFCQALFYEQWSALKADANEQGVDIVGDVPIYVAPDSADVWANPELFQLEDGQPAVVAGVPDAEETPGQKWGNPVYDWDRLAETGYDWWLRRLAWQFDLADYVRIDHFVGFIEYYTVPRDAGPLEGWWNDGPGMDVFDAARERFDELPIIVEDVGPDPEGLDAVRKALGAPGLCVPQYADWCSEDHESLPANCPTDSVVYPSTHDTNTVRGFYEGLDDEQRECLIDRLGTSADTVHWDMIEAAWHADPVLAITMLQDFLGLDGSARFNTPGTAEGNWRWRVTAEQLATLPTDRMADLTNRSDRDY